MTMKIGVVVITAMPKPEIPQKILNISVKLAKIIPASKLTRYVMIPPMNVIARTVFAEYMTFLFVIISNLSDRVSSSLNPHHSVNVQNTNPRNKVDCISFCIESAATNLVTGSPVGIAHVTGYSSEVKAESKSPLSSIFVEERFWNGCMSSIN